LKWPNTRSSMLAEPSIDHLRTICSILNQERTAELKREMRRLVQAWQDSGPNLMKMFKDHPELDGSIAKAKAELVPSNTGRAYWKPNPPQGRSTDQDYALAHFLALIAHPAWERLAGPCQRCGDYYIKKTKRQKVYCSQSCGSAYTAALLTRKRRAENHQRDIHAALEWANKWVIASTPFTCKKWIASHTSLTVKWLTRAENNGELALPEKTTKASAAPKIA
jgi:hypothetical protein